MNNRYPSIGRAAFALFGRATLAFFAAFFLFSIDSKSQCAAGNSCYSAPLVCGSSLDGATFSTGGSNELSQPQTFCGVIENNQWIAFVACQSTVSIQLQVNSCAGTFTGSGLQAQIFASADCQNFTGVSNCFNPGTATSGVLTANGLAAGQIYYLMVDGWASDVCNYTVNVLAGIDLNPPTPMVSQAGSITGPTSICPNQTAQFTAVLPQCSNQSGSGCPLPSAAATGNLIYNWTLPAGATVVGSANSSTISILFGQNSGNLEVQVTNSATGDCGCNWACPTVIAPLFVHVQSSPSQTDTLPPVVICEGQTYAFCGIDYATTSYPSCMPQGCQTSQIQPILVLPTQNTTLPPQVLCGSDCVTVGGQPFCSSGFFTVSSQVNGVCENISFELQQVWIDGYWSSSNVIHPSEPTSTLNGSGSATGQTTGQVTFSWSGPGIDASNQNAVEPVVSAGGTYLVTVTDAQSGCTFSYEVIVYEQPHDCDLPAPPGNFCQFAPTLCGKELDAFCSFTQDFTGETPGNLAAVFCGSIQNSAWVKFLPCESTVKIRITPSECADSMGIEAAIFETADCENFILKSNCLAGIVGDTLVAPNLTPGATYYIMIDGLAGDRCKWEADVIAGLQLEAIELTQTVEPKVTGAATACPGQTKTYDLLPPDCQVKNSQNCPLDGLLDSLEIKWFAPPGAQIIGDSTKLTVQIEWNSGMGGDVFAIVRNKLTLPEIFCVGENGCGDFAKMAVKVENSTTVLPAMTICKGQTFAFCNQIFSATTDAICPDPSGCGQTMQPIVVQNPKRQDFGTISICPNAPYIFEGKSYATAGFHQVLAQNGVCTDTVQFNLEVKNEAQLELSTVISECDQLGLTYRVQFDFANGVAPFFINGAAISTGLSYKTNPIQNLLPYFLTITDSGTCLDTTIILQGEKDCKCTTVAASMTLDTIANCPANSLILSHLGGENLDADDDTEFVLHTSNQDSLGQILAIDTVGKFTFLPSMTLGTTYFVSLVAGNGIDGGYVDLTDRCLDVSAGQPVVFFAPPEAEAGPPASIDCVVPTAVLTGSFLKGSPRGVDYFWSKSPNFSSNLKTPTIDEAGDYFLKVTDKWTGCTGTDQTTVTSNFAEPGVAAFGQTLFCEPATVTLLATSPTAGVQFFWKMPDGQTATGANLTTDQIGLFEVKAAISSGCFSTTTTTILDGRKRPTLTVSNGVLTCYEPDFQIITSANFPSSFSWTGPMGFVSTAQNPTVSTVGKYFLTATELVSKCKTTDTAFVSSIISYPVVSIAKADTLTCSRQSVKLDGSATTASPNIILEWSSALGLQIQNAATAEPTVSSAGFYILTATNTSNGCTDFGQVEIVENTNRPEIIWIEKMEPSCFGKSDGWLEVSDVAGGERPLEFAIESGIFSSVSAFFGLKKGFYELKVRDRNGCIETQNISLNEPELLKVELGQDREIDLGEAVDLFAATTFPFSEIDSISWKSTSSLASDSLQTWSPVPFETTFFWVWVESVGGCFDSDTIRVRVKRAVPIFVPNIFSPNGDGENDRLQIFCGGGVKKVHLFQIYDRWGEQVFSAEDFEPNDPDIFWDGMLRGKRLPPAVFTFHAAVELVDGRLEMLKGDVTIAR